MDDTKSTAGFFMNNRLEKFRKMLVQTAALFAVCLGTQQFASGLPQSGASTMQLAGVALENRFIATGVITSIQPPAKNVHKFMLRIEKTEQLEGYANFGADYQGKEVEVSSQIGMPSPLKVGATVSVVLRIAGDEWQQVLFLVEVVKNGSGK